MIRRLCKRLHRGWRSDWRHPYRWAPSPLARLEPLEPRLLLSSAVPIALFGPGRPKDPEAFALATQPHPFQFSDTSRWSTTATDGAGLAQGDPTTLTWGIIDDGTAVPGSQFGDEDAPSDLVGFLNGLYGSVEGAIAEQPWFGFFQQVFDRWTDLSGITFVFQAADDGAELTTAPGELGVRPDIRIGGHFIDGEGFGVLAYNFFPTNGDMVIDTGDPTFFGNPTDNSLGLRNTLAHEVGHGIGINHVLPTDGTKLMEPFINLAFDGPQHDDILAAHRGYGDPREPSDDTATATNLGAVTNETITIDDVSIDDNSDVDLYRFTVSAGKQATVAVRPLGFTYLQGPEVGPGGGPPPPPTPFNSRVQSDLAVEILDSDGVTVLGTSDNFGVGVDELIENVQLPLTGGLAFIRVTGDQNNAQFYEVELTVSDSTVDPSIGDLVFNDINGDGVKDADEPGIDGIAVNLYVDDGDLLFDPDLDALTQTQVTADGGAYDFTPLDPSFYWVQPDQDSPLLDGFVLTTDNNPLLVNLLPNQDVNDADFGFQQRNAFIGDLVFNDLNGDGVRDLDEPGLEAITVRRYLNDGDGNFEPDDDDVLLETQVTPADGSYGFINLPAGSYWVDVNDESALLAGFELTAGTDPLLINLAAGEVFETGDFGYFGLPAQISGLKFNDENGNGRLDGSGVDQPIGQIVLAPVGQVILGPNDDFSTDEIDFGFDFDFFDRDFDSFFINNNGNITFDAPLFNFTPTDFPTFFPMIAPFWADVDTSPFESAKVHLARGTSPRDQPFVQIDWPGVGFFFEHTELLNDFTLYIEDDPAGDIIGFFYDGMQWTTGDASGGIDGFGQIGAQIGYDAGDLQNFVSFGRPNSPATLAQFSNSEIIFRVPTGAAFEFETGLAGVQIYLDLNNNGVLDADEPVTITAPDDPDTSLVNEAGTYTFTGLEPGDYVVREVVPAGFSQTFPLDPDGLAGQGSLELLAGDGGTQATFVGNVGVSTDALGTDADDIIQATVPADATIEMAYLHVATRTAGEAQGFQPEFIRFGGQDVAITWLGNVQDTANENFETGRADVTDIVAANIDPAGGAFDFAVDETTTAQPGNIEGTTLTVIYSSPTIATTQTVIILEGGVTGPRPQTDLIRFDAPIDTSDPDFVAQMSLGIQNGNPGNDQFSTVDIDGTRLTTSAGGDDDSAVIPSELGTRITYGGIGDLTDNPTDPMLTDNSLDDELYDLTPLLTDGQIEFELRLANPSGDDSIFVLTLVVSGAAEQSDPTIGEGASLVGAHRVHLIHGEFEDNRDFGNVPLGSISGRKFQDTDGNGFEGVNEPGLEGWTIFIDDNENGLLDEDEQFTVTVADNPDTPNVNEEGTYTFVDLLTDTYTIAEVLQDGFIQTVPDFDETLDPEPIVVDVEVGQNIVGVNFGNFQLAQVRGLKFQDTNADGIRDPGEPVLADWTIFLDNDNDGELDPDERSVLTDADGLYEIDGIRPGAQTVAEIVQDGFAQTAPQFFGVLSGDDVVTQVPVETDGAGIMRAVIDVTTNNLTIDISFAALGSDPQEVTINAGPAGVIGPVVYRYDPVTNQFVPAQDNDDNGPPLAPIVSPIFTTFEVLAEDLIDLRTSNLYVNITTEDMPDGELRTQINAGNTYPIVPTSGEIFEHRDFGNAPLTDLPLGDGGVRTVEFTENDGTEGAVTITRAAGSAMFVGGQIALEESRNRIVVSGVNVRLFAVEVSESGLSSTLTLTGRGGDDLINVVNVNVRGTLGIINGRAANLHGDVDVMGMTRRVDFNHVIGPSQFNVGLWDGRKKLRVTLQDAMDLSINSRMPISTFRANQVLNTDGLADLFELPFITTLISTGDFASSVTLTDTTVRESIRRATIGGWLDGSTIQAPKNIGTFRVGAARDANVFSGVRPDAQIAGNSDLPDSPDDFFQELSLIRDFRTTGIAGEEFDLINTNIAAWDLRRVTVGKVNTANSRVHGIAGHLLNRYFRDRDLFFSPINRKLAGPVVFDEADAFVVRLV